MADSNLPPGWILLSDPATNMPYYYNEQTFASSWDHPGHGSPSFNPAAAATPSRSPYYPNTAASIHSVRSQYSTRSSEWDEYFDEAANAPYFINRNTHETAWEKPRASPVKLRMPLQPVSHNNTPYSGVGSPNKTVSMGGSPYVPQPSPAGIASPLPDMSPNYSGGAGAGVQPLNLPHPWQEFWDADSSTPYYVNPMTNESSWERPTSQAFRQEYNPALEAPHSISSASPVHDSHHHLRHAKTWGAWEELFDYDNNSHYYYNSSTQESLWEPPQGWPLGSAGGGGEKWGQGAAKRRFFST